MIMNKSVKSFIYKGNIFNFIVLTLTSLFQSAALILISLMLEKVLAIASNNGENALNELTDDNLSFLAELISVGFVDIRIVKTKGFYNWYFWRNR